MTPDDFDAFVDGERLAFEARYGSYEAAAARLEVQGNLDPLRPVRGAYAGVRANERAEARGEVRTYKADAAEKIADREARRTIAGTGHAVGRNQFSRDDHPRIDALAASYVVDGAALEVLRLPRARPRLPRLRGGARPPRRARLRRADRRRHEAVQDAPNVLRRWQRQFRYLLVDEFQDANVAQIELIELLGRTPDRPDNVMVVGDDDQSIYRFRGASFAAFAEFDARFSRPPAHDPGSDPARSAAAPPDRAELPVGAPRPDRRPTA